jgi:undecaprenyl-diphosphatase
MKKYFAFIYMAMACNCFADKSDVNAFDRILMFEYSRPLDITGDVMLSGMFFMPALSLYGNFSNGAAWAAHGIMYAQSIFLVFGTTEIIKISVLRNRPYFYTEEKIPKGKENDFNKSFPSRHTAFAFMAAGFLTSTFSTEHPNSSWKIPLCIASYSLATGVGASRIFSGNHFLSDVLAGAAIGSIYGYLIPRLYSRKNSDKPAPAPTGLMFTFRF